MTLPAIVHKNSFRGLEQFQEYFHGLVTRISLIRLFVLILLLIPLGLTFLSKDTPLSAFVSTFLEPDYFIFLLSGFALTFFFLTSQFWFRNNLFLLRLQLTADIFLASFLIWITGGVGSNFSFLFLALLFLYGRILGPNTANQICIFMIIFLITLGILHTFYPFVFNLPPYPSRQIIYYLSLHFLSLALILMLLKMGVRQESRLLAYVLNREEQFKHSELLKSKVFDWMGSGLLVIDNKTRISVINKKGMELGKIISSQEIVGQPLDKFFPNLAKTWFNWDKVAPLRTEIPLGEEMIIGATFTSIPEEQSSLIIFSDITRIKQLERQVLEMEKLATLGELAAGLAHEIKNPLAGIKASLQLLSQGNLNSDQTTRLNRVIQRDIGRLDHLLSDFLSFARPGEPTFQKINLKETVQNCLLTLTSQYTWINFTMDKSIEHAIVTWDPDQLHQVLLNLLLNSIQATTETKEPVIAISWQKDEGPPCLVIRDNGCGLNPEGGKNIFDPFVTTKKEGSGLGLSIAQRLANQNNSWIEVKNNDPEPGAQARIYFSNINLKKQPDDHGQD